MSRFERNRERLGKILTHNDAGDGFLHARRVELRCGFPLLLSLITSPCGDRNNGNVKGHSHLNVVIGAYAVRGSLWPDHRGQIEQVRRA